MYSLVLSIFMKMSTFNKISFLDSRNSTLIPSNPLIFHGNEVNISSHPSAGSKPKGSGFAELIYPFSSFKTLTNVLDVVVTPVIPATWEAKAAGSQIQATSSASWLSY